MDSEGNSEQAFSDLIRDNRAVRDPAGVGLVMNEDGDEEEQKAAEQDEDEARTRHSYDHAGELEHKSNDIEGERRSSVQAMVEHWENRNSLSEESERGDRKVPMEKDDDRASFESASRLQIEEYEHRFDEMRKELAEKAKKEAELEKALRIEREKVKAIEAKERMRQKQISEEAANAKKREAEERGENKNEDANTEEKSIPPPKGGCCVVM